MTVETFDVEQGTEAWLDLRRGMLTASTVGALISRKPPAAEDYDCPQCKAAPGYPCMSMAKRSRGPIKVPHSPRVTKANENPDGLSDRLAVANNDTARDLLALIVSERITGWSDPSFFSADMQRGHDVEPIARDWYAEHYSRPVRQTGFIVRTLPSGARIGWSPDGLVSEDGGIEVKAPRAKAHLRTILEQRVPPQHEPQCQAAMFVSGREYVDFCSYYGGMKPFVKRVEADPEWFEVLTRAVEWFEGEAIHMRAEYDRLTAELPETERLLFDLEMVI